METHPPPDLRIILAEKLNGGVFVTFDDGTCAFFSAALLHATLPQAQVVNEDELIEED